MAGVRLGQFAEVVHRGPDDQVVRGRRTRSFGRVHRFCLEGDQCAWKVKGGGFLTLALDALDDEVIALSTNARRWRTPAGIARGSTAFEVATAYPAARKRTRCVPPAGAQVTGFLLRDDDADTFFEMDGGRVERIHVVDRARRCR